MLLREKLAPVYDDKLPSAFDVEAPKEEKSTCHDCAMCAKGEAAPGATYFLKETKCCTYHPSLPSYLAGGLLADDRPAQAEGRRRLTARIERRVGVTPHWVGASQRYWALWNAARESSFGRTTTLACPYLADGMCSIWEYRDAECSTFFCKHDDGLDGKLFWNAARDYVRWAERRLSAHAVGVVAPDVVEPERVRGEMTLEELEERAPDPETYASWWRSWEGREAELYRATWEVVRGMSRDEVLAVVNDERGRALHDELVRLHAVMRSDALPERLVMNPRATLREGEGGAVVTTFSKYEPLFLNDTLLAVLREMTPDETVDAFRARMLERHEIDVPASALVALKRFRVVVEP